MARDLSIFSRPCHGYPWASPAPKRSLIPAIRQCVLLWHCNHGGYIAVPILYLPVKTRNCDSKFLKNARDQGRRALEELIDFEAGGEVATPVPVLVTDGLCAFSVDHSRLRAPPARPSAELCQPDLHRWLIPHWPPHSLPTGRSESRADELQPRPWAHLSPASRSRGGGVQLCCRPALERAKSTSWRHTTGARQ